MKVVELQSGFGIDSLQVGERPDPQPGRGQVLVRMKAWSLNYRDLLVAQGLYNPKLKFPFIPLSDGVGEVLALGEGVATLRVGERVAGCFMPKWTEGELTEARARASLGGGIDGVLAEMVVFDELGVVSVPEHLTDEEAATLPCAALTAWQGLVTHGHVKAGESVLVQGTGGVSLFALQFAKLHGAQVFAISGNDAKLERLRGLGVANAVNYRTTPDWGDRVRDWTGGVGVDHVVEVGGAGTLPQSFRAVRMGGHVSLIGVLAGTGNVNPLPVLMKHVRMQGIFVGPRSSFAAMNRAIALHGLKPIVDRVYGFGEVREALRHLESGAHFGKVCLRI